MYNSTSALDMEEVIFTGSFGGNAPSSATDHSKQIDPFGLASDGVFGIHVSENIWLHQDAPHTLPNIERLVATENLRDRNLANESKAAMASQSHGDEKFGQFDADCP